MKNVLLSPQFTQLTQRNVLIYLIQVCRSWFIVLCVFIINGFIPILQAQSSFEKNYGTPNSKDAGIDLIQTKDGGYAIVGRTQAPNSNRNKAWFIKTDAKGNVEWQKIYTFHSHWRAVAEMKDGYILAGYSYWRSSPAPMGLLIKIDLVGNLVWSTILPSEDNSTIINDVIVDNTNHIVATGSKKRQIYVVKLDATGQIIWEQYYLYPSADGQHLSLLEDGHYLVGGGRNETSFNNWYWLAKINQNGNTVWTTSGGAFGFRITRVFTAQELKSGGYLLSIVDKAGSGNLPYSGKYLVKIDNKGTVLRSIADNTSLNSHTSGFFSQALQDNLGNCYFIGTQQRTDRSQFIQIRRVNDKGFLLNEWDFNKSVNHDVNIMNALLTKDGAIAMVGSLFHENTQDVFFLKTDTIKYTTPSNTFHPPESMEEGLSISTAPDTKRIILYFKYNLLGLFTIQIEAEAGEVVYTNQSVKNATICQENISIKGFSKGKYLITAKEGRKILATCELVVE